MEDTTQRRLFFFSAVCLLLGAAALLFGYNTARSGPAPIGRENWFQVARVPVSTAAARSSLAAKQKLLETYGKLPLSFEANKGQTDGEVKFLAHPGGYTLFLTPTEAVLALAKPTPKRTPPGQVDLLFPTTEPQLQPAITKAVLWMKLVGKNATPQVEGLNELPGEANYFIGKNPQKWRTNVPNYSKVQYKDVYPGVDLIYYGNQRQLECDFVVAQGADPKSITLFEGADRLEVDAQGDLLLYFLNGEVRFRKPYVYQASGDAGQEVAGGYVLKDTNQVAFELASYDATQPLIIDPVLVYSTFLGGSGTDRTRSPRGQSEPEGLANTGVPAGRIRGISGVG